MSTLSSEVQARLPTRRLVELTNPGSTSASTIDATVLGYACTDVEAVFTRLAATSFDASTATHVEVAVRGVELYLRAYAGTASAEELASWRQEVESLARVTGRDRLSPETTSEYEIPSRLTADGEYPYHWSDPEQFEDLMLDPPAGR